VRSSNRGPFARSAATTGNTVGRQTRIAEDSSPLVARWRLTHRHFPPAANGFSDTYGRSDHSAAWHASCNSTLWAIAMKPNRVWFETLAFGTAIACACAFVIATLAVLTAAVTQPASAEVAQTATTAQADSASSEPLRVFEGMVTCSRCGAKHSAALGRSASDCTRQCVHGGAAFALVEGEQTYQLSGELMALKKVAGQRARLVGAIHGNTIQVSSVATAN